MTTTIEIEDVWSQVLDAMRPELNKPVFRDVDRARRSDVDDRRRGARRRGGDPVREGLVRGAVLQPALPALSSVTGIPSQVEVVVDPSHFAVSAPSTSPPWPSEPRCRGDVVGEGAGDGVGFNPKYTFDSFVVGDSNRLAATAALAVADEPGVKYNPLFLWGGPGLGKTHLLHAIANHVRRHYPGKNVLYVTSERFTNDYINSMASRDNKRIDRFRQHYRQADVLLIDDVQFLKGKEGTLEEFFNTFNWLEGPRQGDRAVLGPGPEGHRHRGAVPEPVRERPRRGHLASRISRPA